MPDATDTPETVYDANPDATADGTDADAGGPANNGVTAHYCASQSLGDVADQFEADLDHTDNPKLYRDGMKVLAELRSLQEKFKGMGDKHDNALTAVKGGGEEPPEPAEGEEDAPDMDTDEDGVMKSIRSPYRVILKAVRGQGKGYSLAEVQKGIQLAAEAERKETIPEALARLKKDDPAAFDRIQRKAKKLRQLNAAA